MSGTSAPSKRIFKQSKTNPQVPYQLIDRTDMTWIEKSTAIVLVRHARNVDGRWIAYPSQATIAEKIGTGLTRKNGASKRPVRRQYVNEAIQSLHERGEITIIPHYIKRGNGYDVTRLVESATVHQLDTSTDSAPDTRTARSLLVSTSWTRPTVHQLDTKYKRSTSSANASDSTVTDKLSNRSSKQQPTASAESDCFSVAVGLSHGMVASGNDGAALRSECFGIDEGDDTVDETYSGKSNRSARDRDRERFSYQPVGMDKVMPSDTGEIEYQVDKGLWAVYRTLPEGSEPPNPGFAERLCSMYEPRRVYRQVVTLQTRLDYSKERIDNPFGLLLKKLIPENLPAPVMMKLRPDRIHDYYYAIKRGDIREADVPAYALDDVRKELKYAKDDPEYIPF